MRVIFDLDGTLADTTHRDHLWVENATTEERVEFYAQCIHDSPIQPIIDINNALWITGHHIEIWTGRWDSSKFETETWLDVYGVHYHNLLMRPFGNHTDSVSTKLKWLKEIPKALHPDLMFDDLPRAVKVFRRRGIQCCLVDEGKY